MSEAARQKAAEVLRDLPGMKESDLLKYAKCICGKPHLNGEITFYAVTISRGGFIAGALQRRAGLELMLGSGPLASVMGPDEDLAKVIAGPQQILVHEGCASRIGHLLELMWSEPEPQEIG